MTPSPMRSAFAHRGFHIPDPFAPRQRRGASFVESLLATTIFRCWHILVLYGAWSTFVTILNHKEYKFYLKPTLLTVVGTVLGFVITFRTTASFDRYNEGRKLWSQIVQSSRMFARTVWFHVPDPVAGDSSGSLEDAKMRTLIEKKSALNLVEAFAVSVKHYLRGEDGIYYKDLYYLVKFLPAFAMSYSVPEGIFSHEDAKSPEFPPVTPFPGMVTPSLEAGLHFDGPPSHLHHRSPASSPGLPRPVTSFTTASSPLAKTTFREDAHPRPRRGAANTHHLKLGNIGREVDDIILSKSDEEYLLSARHPPNYGLFEIFPFYLIRRALIKRSKGRTARSKMRAKLRSRTTAHNLPLEITLYISSYIAALQKRKALDVPTSNQLLGALTQMVDSLSGLERILTTPIPFSYSVHLWVVTTLYVFFLPLQIWSTMKWLTIPATVICSFMFFGFLVAGEEIENPFGYDKNDLDLDQFTHIIRCELKAIASAPPPDPARWAFVMENNLLFSSNVDERISPSEWMKIGHTRAMQSLSMVT